MKTKNTIYFTALLLFGLFGLFAITSCSKDDDCTELTWYQDADGDGFGNLNSTISSCNQPANFVSNSADIDDSDANLNPKTVWQGSKITFTKADSADWTLEANQDRITDSVWITRQHKKGLFNIVVESSDPDGACDGPEPTDTEWAYGTTLNIPALTFEPLGDLIGCNFTTIVDGKDMVLHLISDNIYIDLKFTSWTKGPTPGGGGFGYERSTKN